MPSLPASAKPCERGVERLGGRAVDRRVGEAAGLGAVEHLGVDLGRGDRHGRSIPHTGFPGPASVTRARECRTTGPGWAGMVRASWNGEVIAESDDTVVVEGNHYFPRRRSAPTCCRLGDAQRCARGRAPRPTTRCRRRADEPRRGLVLPAAQGGRGRDHRPRSRSGRASPSSRRDSRLSRGRRASAGRVRRLPECDRSLASILSTPDARRATACVALAMVLFAECGRAARVLPARRHPAVQRRAAARHRQGALAAGGVADRRCRWPRSSATCSATGSGTRAGRRCSTGPVRRSSGPSTSTAPRRSSTASAGRRSSSPGSCRWCARVATVMAGVGRMRFGVYLLYSVIGGDHLDRRDVPARLRAGAQRVRRADKIAPRIDLHHHRRRAALGLPARPGTSCASAGPTAPPAAAAAERSD